MTPTLIVPGPARDWLPRAIVASPFIANVHEPKLCWVPVTTLPAVPSDEWVSEDRGGGHSEIVAEPRPLRAGDTVTLATVEHAIGSTSGRTWRREHPFATAEVAERAPVFKMEGLHSPTGGNTPMRRIMQHDSGRFHFEDCETGEITELPGDWSSAQYGVRLTHVEALSGHVDSAVTPEEAQALRVESINERHARLQGESS